MDQQEKCLKISMTIVLLVLLAIFFVGITREVVVRVGLFENNKENMVLLALFGNDMDNFVSNKSDLEEHKIDWSKEYPYTMKDLSLEHNESTDAKALGNNAILQYMHKNYSSDVVKGNTQRRSKREKLLTKYIAGNMKMIELAKKYDNFIGWQLTAPDEYNGVRDIGDGYFARFSSLIDTSTSAREIIELSSWCEQHGIHFLYVQAPGVINENNDVNISGVLDFSNQNANELLAKLTDNNVNVLDLRTELALQAKKDNKPWHEYFYRTDHHWKVDTGLWASGKIAQHVSKICDLDIDLSLYDKNRYHTEFFEKWFLGSAGKKVTLMRTEPDDFELWYPDFATNFEIEIPTLKLHEKGDFKVFIDMSSIYPKNYYNANPYAAYSYGDTPVIIGKNLDINKGKILLIRDSFSEVIIPFLNLSYSEVRALDLRKFNGSVKKYIESYKPDIVVVEYYVNSIKEVEYQSHINEFDFR